MLSTVLIHVRVGMVMNVAVLVAVFTLLQRMRLARCGAVSTSSLLAFGIS